MRDAPTLVSRLDDVAVVGDPVQQRGSHLLVAEHLRPLTEGEVGGDYVESRVKLPDSASPSSGACSSRPESDLRASVGQRVDELDSGEEPDSEVMVSDGLRADGGGEMGLAGARSGDHHDVVGVGDEVTSMQGVEQRLIGGAFIEMEAAEVAIGWEAGGPHRRAPPPHGPATRTLLGDRDSIAR